MEEIFAIRKGTNLCLQNNWAHIFVISMSYNVIVYYGFGGVFFKRCAFLRAQMGNDMNAFKCNLHKNVYF